MSHRTTLLRRLVVSTAVAISATLATGVVAASARADTAAVTAQLKAPGVMLEPVYAGPARNYPQAAPTAHFDPYIAVCTWAPYGPNVPSSVWDKVAEPSDPSTPVGYLPDDDLNLTRGGSPVTGQILPACPAPPPPPEPANPNTPVIKAPPPDVNVPKIVCAHGILGSGVSMISFDSAERIDVQFDGVVASNVDVNDPQTGTSASGTVLPLTASTPNGSTSWHFTETAGTGITRHNLNVQVGGGLGGSMGGTDDGSVEGDVGYTVRSTACG